MAHFLLLNPNTSVETTVMMVGIAQSYVPEGVVVIGATVESGVPMITTEAELEAAAQEVVVCWRRQREQPSGVIVGAFGDPGLDQLRAMTEVPCVGLCEAAMLEASAEGRRFGVATVTPGLIEPIDRRAVTLQLGKLYTGIRLTPGNPRELANRPRQLIELLAVAVEESIELDGAEAVIIGGGPLGQAALALTGRFSVPIIAPVPAATRQLMRLM
ncbi:MULTISPECIES: aspartate/glutamate racemase family protein [Paraburkholderia]|uniref:Hydantoin racemase n=1 Tax=Paraburkholderia nemoris TaxID=2793076 RepID=A0ABM8T6U8_9BURK|nr:MULTISPECIES: aspartate/glutamate racemase family protein [Paraburkholderia]KPD14542.1 hydantoin racemase [Burkholderia sp. ST111]MBK5186217.1 aspartate/glutamate racemase family protein [Burkholderia sp. R-69749]MBK3742491.1 aspartate/glutamate racemase family protein [Paraburkholderia aspalathi]MBK3816497.1 aspartate/glutamate racemase family protein [Paraburkholderia aspalathi]CAE6789193.1 Hydantoin racemase [Paraburkholderia nemoris]